MVLMTLLCERRRYGIGAILFGAAGVGRGHAVFFGSGHRFWGPET
jgi:hypothetical protein